MTRRAFLLAALFLGAPGASLAGEGPPLWVVVTAPAFRAAVEPLCRQRKAQGMEVRVVQTTDVLTKDEILSGEARKLRLRVNELCRDHKGRAYVLLVGAIEPGNLADADAKVLPPLQGTVSRMKGRPSDNGYGCPGDDLLPSAAVGRFPAHGVAEAEAMARKTLAFERDQAPGEWRRQMTILAGVPAYNPLVDRLVESLALARFDKLDPSWGGRAIYHNAQSRFCVPDNRLHDRALDYVQQGQAITLYLGHSNAYGFYAGQARFLDREDWAGLKIRRGPGIFATFGCNGCQLSGREGQGYGLAAFRNPNGPAAVLGSHGICFAAMVQLAADGLFESLVAGKPPERLGEAWLALKKGLARGKIDDFTFRLLDAVDGDSRIPQAVQRLEHLEMFVLLGDPAVRLPVLPQDVRLKLAGRVAAGETISVRGEVPGRLADARVRITVERPLTSMPADFQTLPEDPAERGRVMLANHERSNRFVVVTKEASVRDGRFEGRIELPAKLPWPRLVVRAYATAERSEGMGVAVVPVQPADNAEPRSRQRGLPAERFRKVTRE